MFRYGQQYAISQGLTAEADIRLEAVKFAAAGGTAGTSLGALASALYLGRTFMRNRVGILAEIAQSIEDSSTVYDTRLILRKIFQYAVPITLGSVAIYTANLIDLRFTKTRLIAGGFSALEASALYGIFSTQYLKVLFIPVTLATALATAIIPSISGLKTILMISVPSAVGMAILAKPIIHMLFPTAPDGWDLLMMGSWILVLVSLVSIQTAILQGIGKTYIPTIHLVIGLVLKVLVNYTLIPIREINIKGAIAGSAVCYIFAAILNYRAIRKLTGVRLNVKQLFNRPLSVSLLMGIFIFLVYHGFLFMTEWFIRSVFLQSVICGGLAIAAGCGMYYLLMIVAKGITADEIKSLPMGARLLEFTARIPYMDRFLK